ncbi:MAG: hypothetical protein ACOYYF_00760 [Chloroflexota bacterium]|nr:hypothetical protein [Chloroflexota bacterium]MBI5703472.1 hypothetical protein [Chloroflexota bacterium]
MKKQHWAGLLVLSLFLNACGTTPAPSENPQDMQETAMAGAFTAVAQTLAALPTLTPPPTFTPLPPTETPLPPSPTLEPTIAVTPTAQAVAFTPTADPCNKPLTSWQGPSASLNIVYDYTPRKKDDKVIVSIWVMTDLGECGYLYNLSTGPVGQYSVIAYVSGAKNFNVSGGFRITTGAWKIVIRNDRIVALGVCYPNC